MLSVFERNILIARGRERVFFPLLPLLVRLPHTVTIHNALESDEDLPGRNEEPIDKRQSLYFANETTRLHIRE